METATPRDGRVSIFHWKKLQQVLDNIRDVNTVS